jgi:tetratricopeptide (TPR) repeat protein
MASVWYVRQTSDAEQARKSIALALKDERLIEPRISGNLAWSNYSDTRGGYRNSEGSLKKETQLELEHARNLVGGSEDSSSEDRVELARSYLASGEDADAKRALDILKELESRGNLIPEALNDLGVALFELEKYDDAISYFSKALESRPALNEALFNRALAASKAGRYEQSRQDWKEFIDKSSDPRWKQEAESRLKDLDSSR